MISTEQWLQLLTREIDRAASSGAFLLAISFFTFFSTALYSPTERVLRSRGDR